MRSLVRTLVAEEGGSVRGSVDFSKLGNFGHVRNLVVASSGVGRTLLAAAAEALRAAGATEWHVFDVPADDAEAIRLYEQLGLRAVHRSTIVRMRWRDVAKLPAELATPLPDEPAVDDEIERALGMPSGRIAMARRRGRALVHLRDRDLAPVGFCAFDPDTGAMPFHVARASLAPVLLARIREHAHRDQLSIVVENHDALATALVAAGGELQRSLLHYSASLSGSSR